MAQEGGDSKVNVKVPAENKRTINLKRKLPSNVQPLSNTANVYSKMGCPEQSTSMQFGWEIIIDKLFPTLRIFIPYIFQTIDNCKQKFVSIRMAEQLFLSKYLSLLHSDVYNTCAIKSFNMTKSEAQLFNEINSVHWDYKFGKIPFDCNDLIITLSDACEFLNYLGFCYDKLKYNRPYPKKVGFVKINKNAVVPYVIQNNNQYLPSFYFDGELSIKKELFNWDYAYLKFCFNVQGIRKDLFTSNSCIVIEFNVLKNMFPADTTFEEYWPDAKQTGRLWNTAVTHPSASFSWAKLNSPFSEHATLPVFVSPENINFQNKLPTKIDPPPLKFLPPKAVHKGLQENLKLLKLSNRPESFVKIKDLPNMSGNPYRMSEIKLDQHVISCIMGNTDPIDNHAVVLMDDFSRVFCKSAPKRTIKNVLDILGIKIYIGNKLQMEFLHRQGKCENITDCVPLLRLADIIHNLAPFKYILTNGAISESESKL